MQKWNDLGKTILLYASSLSILVLAFSISIFALQAREAAVTTEKNIAAVALSVNGLVAKTDKVMASLDTTVKTANTVAESANVFLHTTNGSVQRFNVTMDTVNHGCDPGPCGTLADVGKTLNTFRGTAGQIEIAANHEDKNLINLDKQEVDVFQDIHSTFANANTLLTSPDIKSTLFNLSSTSKSAADSTAQMDAAITDVRGYADKLAHPSKKKLTFWTATEAGGDYVRHFMPPIF